MLKPCHTCPHAGRDDGKQGQLADILTSTFTTANSNNRTIGVASAVGGALASMSGSAFGAMCNETIRSLNDLVTDISCSVASTVSIGKSHATQIFSA